MNKATYFIQPMEFTGIPNTLSWAGYDFLQWTGDTFHPGLDYNYGAGEEDNGKPIKCVGNGLVEKILTWDGKTKGFGNHVFIKHKLEDGTIVYSHYAHLDSIACIEGQDINIGDEIGKCGGSGGWPSHLHFEIRLPIGKGYDFWPKGMSKDWIAANYFEPFGFIEKRKEVIDAQGGLDQLREERDRNWNLYQSQIEENKKLSERITVLEGQVNEWKTKYEDEQKHTTNLNEQIANANALMEKIKNEDYEYGLKTASLEKEVIELKSDLKSIADVLSVHPDIKAILKALDELKQPSDEVAKEYLKLAKALENFFYTRVPKAKPFIVKLFVKIIDKVR